ncbi:uncharacterized protein BT62DRAFT_1006161 [Guyanagaster necrorhizus]|uniref:Uncharacterized protein n=1 Tax=Guyanagaster necrorhizus TaxID=856835 RepID=A0A9P8AS71_9AGAR|nr:uncharacterized protein BT62DRAFT_1006161 [Guyanagaster necrorhizus MCA 3950]KAG7445984.1 hypothetical protein BT62DRAFT_1006161 [Guyanagaster necrorhizus MCA 3950]
MSSPRAHRLPLNQRLDYTLIPAPLDLSLPSLTEKSPLPAIIVTPSSPVSTHDFSIAFLAPESKPSILKRLSLKARTVIIILFILFILVCHLVTHRLAAGRPYLDFHEAQTSTSWYHVPSFWGPDIPEDKRNFIISETMPS